MLYFEDCPITCLGHAPDKPDDTKDDLRVALDRLITTGEIDEYMYHNDPTYHGIIYMAKDSLS